MNGESCLYKHDLLFDVGLKMFFYVLDNSN